jgi:hypothetical protein
MLIPRRLIVLNNFIPIKTKQNVLVKSDIPKFCKNCKFFVLPENTKVKDGLCMKYGSINLVDGSILLEKAANARNACKGDLYEENEELFKDIV